MNSATLYHKKFFASTAAAKVHSIIDFPRADLYHGKNFIQMNGVESRKNYGQVSKSFSIKADASNHCEFFIYDFLGNFFIDVADKHDEQSRAQVD